LKLIRALYQRKKGRDLFDFWFAFQNRNDISTKDIVHAFNYYMEKSNNKISRKLYQSNLEAKQASEVFNADIMPLLALNNAQDYSLNEAYNILLKQIVPLLDE
jgi:hypothetical protein